MFKEISIIGLGFMGASLAAAVKNADPSVNISGYDIDPKNIKFCIDNKLIDLFLDFGKPDSFLDVSEPNNGRLTIICIPPGNITDIIERHYLFFKNCRLVTDVASIKGFILHSDEFKSLKLENFVGSHPMCGSDKSGPESYDPALFKSKNCIVIDCGSQNKESLIEETALFWQMIGMSVTRSTVDFHDETVSFTSHLPHLISFALSESVLSKIKKNDGKNALRFISGGFMDTTRIAASSPALWSDIFLQNRENLLRSLDEFMAVLNRLKGFIDGSDKNVLLNELSEISMHRKNLTENLTEKNGE